MEPEGVSCVEASLLIAEWLTHLRSLSAAAPPCERMPVDECELRSWAKSAGFAESQVTEALAATLRIPWLRSLAGLPTSADFIQQIPIHFARQCAVIGLAADCAVLPVVCADLSGWQQLDVIGRFLARDVVPRLAPREEVLSAINIAYQQRSGQTEELIETFSGTPELDELRTKALREDLLDVSGRAPVIQLVNLILFDAVKTRASDVHIQPYEERVVIRFRIDGVLFDQFTIPKLTQDEMVSRVKVLGA